MLSKVHLVLLGWNRVWMAMPFVVWIRWHSSIVTRSMISSFLRLFASVALVLPLWWSLPSIARGWLGLKQTDLKLVSVSIFCRACKQQVASTKRDTVGVPIPSSHIDPVHVAQWLVCEDIWLSDADFILHRLYGNDVGGFTSRGRSGIAGVVRTMTSEAW